MGPRIEKNGNHKIGTSDSGRRNSAEAISIIISILISHNCAFAMHHIALQTVSISDCIKSIAFHGQTLYRCVCTDNEKSNRGHLDKNHPKLINKVKYALKLSCQSFPWLCLFLSSVFHFFDLVWFLFFFFFLRFLPLLCRHKRQPQK